MGFGDLSSSLSEAIGHDENTRELEQRWKVKRKSGKISQAQARAQKELQQLDSRMERTLSALRKGAESVIKGAHPEQDKELIQTVDAFLDEVLPGGVHAVSGLPYREELLAVESIVKKLQSEKIQPIVKKLGVEAPAQRLAALAPLYKTTLDAAGETIEFGTVRAARAPSCSIQSSIRTKPSARTTGLAGASPMWTRRRARSSQRTWKTHRTANKWTAGTSSRTDSRPRSALLPPSSWTTAVILTTNRRGHPEREAFEPYARPADAPERARSARPTVMEGVRGGLEAAERGRESCPGGGMRAA
jgi:hypothetical protein